VPFASTIPFVLNVGDRRLTKKQSELILEKYYY